MDGCNDCPYPNSEVNRRIKYTGTCSSIMLANKNTHGIIEHLHIGQAAAACALSLKMNDGCTGEIIIFIPLFLNPVTQVNILAVHKKCLIKSSHFIQNF